MSYRQERRFKQQRQSFETDWAPPEQQPYVDDLLRRPESADRHVKWMKGIEEMRP